MTASNQCPPKQTNHNNSLDPPTAALRATVHTPIPPTCPIWQWHYPMPWAAIDGCGLPRRLGTGWDGGDGGCGGSCRVLSHKKANADQLFPGATPVTRIAQLTHSDLYTSMALFYTYTQFHITYTTVCAHPATHTHHNSNSILLWHIFYCCFQTHPKKHTHKALLTHSDLG